MSPGMLERPFKPAGQGCALSPAVPLHGSMCQLGDFMWDSAVTLSHPWKCIPRKEGKLWKRVCSGTNYKQQTKSRVQIQVAESVGAEAGETLGVPAWEGQQG